MPFKTVFRYNPGGSTAASARVHAVGLVRVVATNNPVARPAVAALARHLALRCGERADARAAAAEATLVILRAMPPHETESFTTFVTKLSRNPKVPQRLLATELAVAMLENLPGPFLPPPSADNAGGTPGSNVVGTPTVRAVQVERLFLTHHGLKGAQFQIVKGVN